MGCWLFFFFKQKTAYEIYQCDWSSDVCSSDLVLDQAGLGAHRLNACGYSLGPRFSPSWMEAQMFYEGAPTVMQPGMVFFLHMILMDSDTNTAMCLGRSYLITNNGNQCLSRHSLEMLRC